jgi:hypothetical protein
MASKPVFSAEFTTTPVIATFDVVRNGAAPVACSVTIPADRYWLGESTDARNILTPLIAALNALSVIGTFNFVVSGTSDNLGVVGALAYTDTDPSPLTSLSFTTMNTVAQDLF